ncbi:MAG: class I SAM-dependent methyltransferase [Dehalococcoidia bacterium]
MSAEPSGAPVRFVGFDSGGEVFLNQGRVLRGIYPGNGALYRKVLHACEAHDLFRFGIVATRELHVNPYPDLPYDLVLEHERIPFISYPHEWPASMLKAAALFHIDLYTELGRQGLTIKDWHPYNILFKGTEPVFVDFTSIIPTDNLQDEEYLTPPPILAPLQHLWGTTSTYIFEMYWLMFVPYFLLPLYLMQRGRYQQARRRMLETTLNASRSVLRKPEVFAGICPARLSYDVNLLLKMLALLDRRPLKPHFWRIVRGEVRCLNVSVTKSNYTAYYKAKEEELAFEPSQSWTNKQAVIYEVIRQLKPATVLDVASNTGWFSVLAAKQGCQVVAFDVDEACMNVLYAQAKREQLPILPLVVDLTNLTPDVFPLEYEDEKHSLIGGEFPLLLATEKRLSCDMVLALGIIHHMALGQNQSFAQIAQLLSALSKKYLVLEFVPRDDRLIVSELAFFPALKSRPNGFDWYTQENLILELKRHFQSIKVTKSFPDARTILICSKGHK